MTGLLIENARLFTARDESVSERSSILVAGDSIEQIATDGATLPAPEGVQRIDSAGQFVMPGMTETHAHLSFADASPFAIGATSVEDATITAVRDYARGKEGPWR